MGLSLWPDLSRPSEEREWMDTRPDVPGSMPGGLAFLERTNRMFGGIDVVQRHLDAWSSAWPPGTTVSILDVGTGGADIPIALVRWARARGQGIRITAVEKRPTLAEVARRAAAVYPEITVVEGDARNLPRERSFDYVTACLFLHHVPVGERGRALHDLDARARRGLIVSDLERTRTAYGAVGLWSLLDGDAWARHDGPLSVRRAFRVEELDALARDAGLPYLRARRERWFRVSLTGQKA